jgi:hypothetical protein
MLAKQAWRILKNPGALSSRILKAVYYPNTELLEATLGSSPSQVWHALIDGRDVLKQGNNQTHWYGGEDQRLGPQLATVRFYASPAGMQEGESTVVGGGFH